MSRGQAIAIGKGGTVDGIFCPMVLVRDGVLYSPGTGPSLAALDLNNYPISTLDAIEIYPRTVDAPVQYVGSLTPCGVIVLRSRER
jgi:hypothetical protein